MGKKGFFTLESPEGDSLRLVFGGNWRFAEGLPDTSAAVRDITDNKQVRHVIFDTSNLMGWDSGLPTFIHVITKSLMQRKISFSCEGLPEGVARLIEMAHTAPDYRGDEKCEERRKTFFEMVGEASFDFATATAEILAFIGEIAKGAKNTMMGKARFRFSDLMRIMEETGAHALPIVTLISILVGMTLAFVGAVQLQMFNAEIFVADLVGIGVTREMAALMTGIILAGRTGASFAASLGTMTANEEIDALKTFGVSPIEYLVLPRMIALVLMTPLLCIYADALGIIGGAMVGVTMLDIPINQFITQTATTVGLDDIAAGLIKATLFGFIVALSGCLRGMQSGRSSEAVGAATTSAVVTGIVFIVVTDSILTVIFSMTGF